MFNVLAKQQYYRDTLANVVSGLGTAKDKTIFTQYVLNLFDKSSVESAYRSDWIVRKIIDIPAQDSTRMWREWQAEADQITKLEELEKQFDIQGKVFQAMVLARLYGGGALVIGVDGAGNEREELDVERVREGSLKFVHAVSKWELTSGELETDINSANWRCPKYYRVSSDSGQTEVHYSRIVKFIGNKIPDVSLSNDGWGDPILSSVNDAVMGAGIVIANIALLIQEAKIDVIKIPNLSENLSTKEYADLLTRRLGLTNQIKSMANALLLDTTEEWNRITASFTGMTDILNDYLICAAGAADIPATRLIGQSPRGLNATGEHDTRNYYDRIKSDQNTVLRPAMAILDEVLIRSALGTRDPDIGYDWRSLWQMTPAEKADLALKKAQAFQIDANVALVDQNALRIGRENQLVEDGTYPGLDQTLQDQEDGKLPTEADQWANDPSMNPDHPQNVAQTKMAEAQAASATKQASSQSQSPNYGNSFK